MSDRRTTSISRKEFIGRSALGIVGAGVAGGTAPAFIRRARAANVEFRKIGSLDTKVSAIGLGGSRVTEPSLIKRVLDAGVNFIDTGRMYAGGRNEELIGRVIRSMRQDIVIQSKIDQKIQGDAAAMKQSIDDSLRALRTDYVDIMIIRGATTEKAVKNPVVREVFEQAKKDGKIRLCGFSAHSSNAHEMLTIGADEGWYDVAMVPYNHSGSFTHSVYGIYSEWDQEKLERAFAYAAGKGMAVIGMKTCSGGPMKTEGEPRGTYREALRWNLRNKNLSTMAVGMGSFREADEDLAAMG